MTAQETKEALLRISEKYGEGIDESWPLFLPRRKTSGAC